MNTQIWSEIKQDLRDRIGAESFQNWIEPLEFTGVEEQQAKFRVPTRFFGSWVEKNYGKEICRLFWDKSGMALQLDFDICESRPIQNTPNSSSQLQSPKIITANSYSADRPDLPSNPLDPRYKFENFVTGKSNELAYSAAFRVASGDQVPFNPLFLYSGVGLGKTHLMHAIAWAIQEQDPNKRVLLLSAEQFMYRFVEALRSKSMYGFKEMFRSVDVLLVDDVQFIAGKDSTQDEFFYTFNALVEQNKQVIISADRAPGDIEGMEERIRSRLQWGLMVDIHPTDYELRLGILKSKAEYQRSILPNLYIEEGVLEFLAQRISSNVRVLEGALTRLAAHAEIQKRPIDLDLVHDALADVLRASRQKLTLDIIIKQTAEFYNIRMSDITGKRRMRSVAYPRQVSIYLAKQLTTRSLPDIGRAFGGRDHSTVIHAVKKIDNLMRQDSQVAEEVEALRRRLEA